jgi:hypothetical protein
LRARGRTFNDQLMRTRAFNNPSIISKLIEFVELDEHGSNIPISQFDPKGFPSHMFYDEIGLYSYLFYSPLYEY